MERIRSLLSSLKPLELDAVNELYSNSITGKRNKRRKLLQITLENPDLDEQEICQKLYGVTSSSAFSHLKKKLLYDILKVFYLVNPESQASLPKNVNKIYVRRTIQVVDHLINRAALDVLDDLVNKTLHLCSKYEFFEEKVLLLQILFGKSAYVKSRKKFDAVYSDLTQAISHVEHFTESQKLKYELFGSFENNNEENTDTAPESHFKKLEKLHKESGLSRVSYNYYQGAIFYHEKRRDFKKAIKAAEVMRSFIMENPPVYSQTDQAGIQMKLAHYNLIAGNADQSLHNALNSAEIFREGTYNEWIAIDFIFRIHLFSEKLDEAEKYLTLYKNHNAFKASKSSKEHYDYYLAALEFKKLNFKESMLILNTSSNLKQIDKEWFIQNRLLDMMCQIEVGNYDIFEFKLTAFRKQFKNSINKHNTRLNTIVQLLKNFNKNSFDFKSLESESESLIGELEAGKGELFWHPLGWELIRFDQWLRSKAENQHRFMFG